MPGKRLAQGRTGLHPTEAAGERTDRRPAGTGKETFGIHEFGQDIRPGYKRGQFQ